MTTQTTTLDPIATAAAHLVADMATTGRLPALLTFGYDFGTLRLHLKDVGDLGWLSDLLGLDPEVITSETVSPSGMTWDTEPALIHFNYERRGKVGDLNVRVYGAHLEPAPGVWTKFGDEVGS